MLKRISILALLLFTLHPIFAQKVKFKKQICYVDNVAFLKLHEPLWTTNDNPIIYYSIINDKALFTLNPYKYVQLDKVLDGKEFVDKPVSHTGYLLKFLGLDLEMYCLYDYKQVVKEIYNAKLLDINQNWIKEKVEEYIKIFGTEKKESIH